MKKFPLLIFILLCVTSLARAQQKASITASATTCSVSNAACLIYGVDPTSGGATFTVGANASGNTLQFEATGDGGATWVALSVTPSNSTTTVTSTTGTGTWQVNVAGYTSIRIRCSTFVGGTSTVSIITSTASAKGGSGSGGGGGTITTCTTTGGIAYENGTNNTLTCGANLTFAAASGATTLTSPSGTETLTLVPSTGTGFQIQFSEFTNGIFSMTPGTANAAVFSLGSTAGISTPPGIAASLSIGADNSSTGNISLANGSASGHTIWGSAATTTNTILGFPTAPATGHVVTCTVVSTTCTLTDGGAAVTVVGSDNQTVEQTGNYGPITLLASGSATGFYVVTVYCEVSTGVATSTIITSIAYHDDTGAQTQNGVQFSGATTGTVQSLTFPIRFVTGTALTYSTSTANSPQYKIFARVQAL